MVVAIRRCPYCKAIIDGVAEYCSNCGTQLLFPEDESKEEEIPGDKIVEEEEKKEEILEAEEAESEKEEPSPESEEEEEGKAEEILEEKEEELEKEEGKEEGEKEAEEEGEEKEEGEKDEEEKELEEAVTPPKVEDIDIKEAEALKMKEAKEIVKKETEKLWASVGTGGEEISPNVDIEFPLPPEEEKEEIEVTHPPQREEIDLRSIRLRRTPDTEKREKEEIEKFVESVKAERGQEDQPSEEEIPPSAEIEMGEEKEIAPPEREDIDLRSIRIRKTPDTEEMEKVEIERFVESIKKERERVKEYYTLEEEIPPLPKEMGEETSEIKEKIPPWAEKIKEEPPQELEDKEEEREIEKTVELGEDFQEKEMKTQVDEPPPPTDEPLPKEDEPPPPTDETIPQEDKPSQPADEPLPPTDKPFLSEKEIGFPEEVDQKVPFARQIREKRRRAVRRRRSKYYAWLKARAFDFVFIAAFSLICLGLASRLMEVSLFRLISASGPPILIFYFALLLFYFGFFILFLGETPGDRLFPGD
jgi:hypothetical protein